jgi:putative hydrolase of the HAD superfamily
MRKKKITTIFVDIGGVLGTNGWDHASREHAIEKFHLDQKEFNARHQLMNDLLEIGKCSLDEYLKTVVFYQKRSFSLNDFKKFMLGESKPYPKMIDLVSGLQKQFGLKVVAVSNESRELTDFRIHKFNLKSFISFFVASCYVGLRKPDPAIYHMALDLAQAKPQEVVYLEDRALYVEKADHLGIHSIQHVDYVTTKAKIFEQFSFYQL